GGAELIDPDYSRFNCKAGVFIGLGKTRHGTRGRMNAALRFGHRHALNAVPAGLELEPGIRPAAVHFGDDFLVAAAVSRALRDDLDLPAVALRVAAVHAEELSREQRRFVAAGAGTDFEENIAIVVGVARQQLPLQFLLYSGKPLPRLPDLAVRELAHGRVGGHLLRRLDVLLSTRVFPVELDHRRDFSVLPRELAVLVEIRRCVFLSEETRHLLE